MIARILASTLCIAAPLAGCSTQVATVVSHDVENGGRAVSVSARGAWPFQGYDDVQAEVQDAVREACEFALTLQVEPDESGNQPPTLRVVPMIDLPDFGKAVGSAGQKVIEAAGNAATKLIEETPVHTLQWTGSCSDLFRTVRVVGSGSQIEQPN